MTLWDKMTPEERQEFCAAADQILQEEIDREVLAIVRAVSPQKLAEDIISIQPMPDIDFEKVAESPLWQSFVDRHVK